MRKQGNITAVIWIDDNLSQEFIFRLNNHLNPKKQPNITTAMQNKQMKPLGLFTKFYRPMIIFDYDENKSFQKCFAYSSLKSSEKEERDGLISFKIPRYEKLFINCPILVPTKYLKQFEFKHEIEHEHRQTVKDHLEYLENEYHATVKESGDILYQYKCIKYNSDYLSKFDAREVQRAHNKMINEYEVERFCKQELESIKQQEQLLIKNKSNGSGQGGLPSDDNTAIVKTKQPTDDAKVSTEL
jgi:hypothetical protein